MATPTDILRLQLMPLAETDWHTKTEANLNRLEEAIASEANISTTGGTTTLTSEDYIADQTRRPILRVTGTLASNAIIQIPTPDSAKIYTVYNATSGSFTLTVRNGASGGTFVVPQGTAMVLLAIASGTALIPLTLAMGTTGLAEAPDGFTLAQILNRGQVDNRVLPLLSRTETTPPGGPSTDDAYYVPTSATGAWSGQDGKIARYNGSSWSFFDLPSEGMLAPIADEGTVLCTHSGALADFVGSGNVADGSITAPKLATNSVTTTKIADANVTEAKLASNSVALAKLKPDVYASENEAKTGTSTTKLCAVAMVKHAAFPAGTRAIFQQTSAPTGWTKDTSTSGLNNSALRFVTGTASNGGSQDFTTAFASRTPAGTVGSTTLTVNQIPLHGHPTYVNFTSLSSIDGHGAMTLRARSGEAAVYSAYTGTPDSGPGHQVGGAGGGQSHTHTFTGTAMDFAVKYTDVVVAVKDAAS